MTALDLYYLDLLGTAVFAYSGASIAQRKGCSISIVCVLGIITAIGGGTIRQWIIQDNTLFWIDDITYLLVCLTTIILGYLSLFTLETNKPIFRILDSLSVTVFVTIGYSVASESNAALPLVIAMGVLTGTGGGIIRDLILFEKPNVIGDIFVPSILIVSILGNHIAMELNLNGFLVSYSMVTMLELRRIIQGAVLSRLIEKSQ